MTSDPLGYYARLGVAPDAAPAELKAAFRLRARRLHPDAEGTGDAAAFMRLKEAYDVLSNPYRRAAYERTALADLAPASPGPDGMAPARSASPELSGLVSRGLWMAGLGGGLIAIVVAAVALFHPSSPPPRPASGELPVAAAPRAPLAANPPAPAPPVPVPPPSLALAGTPDHYVLPGAGPATVWRGDPAGGSLSPDGVLPAFAPVHVPALPAPGGLLPIALAGGRADFVAATRLMPGNALAAQRANCAYSAGDPPANGEVLASGGSGTADAHVTLVNASTSPAVVMLRDSAGRDVLKVYLAPRGIARLSGLALGPWTAEVAFGELWSRACTAFVAGGQVLRAPAPVPQGGTLAIGPHAPNG